MQNILFIVGSLRRESYNRQLAKQAEELLKGKANVSYLDFADMPFMNQDIEFPAPCCGSTRTRRSAESRRNMDFHAGIQLLLPRPAEEPARLAFPSS